MGTRLIITMAFLAIGLSLGAQNVAEGQRGGLLQATASFYPSWMLNHDVQNNYLAGHLTYYPDDHYSFRGEALVYIDAQGENKVLNDHVQIQAGFGRHFPVKRWDPFVYAQLGLSAVQLTGSGTRYYQPAVGLTAGVHYNVSRFFYFFGECAYTHMQDPVRIGPLDQLLVSGGLGFQVSTRK